jgi:hypothetical protein
MTTMIKLMMPQSPKRKPLLTIVIKVDQIAEIELKIEISVSLSNCHLSILWLLQLHPETTTT